MVAFTVLGCSRGDAPADPVGAGVAEPTEAGVEAEPAAPATPTPPDAWEPDEERKSLPSSSIYYTLTDYPWYARGEPLLYEGRAHEPAGLPIAASVEEMEKVGEYEGVEFYTRRNDADRVLYVPVFEGYWLAFRPSAIGAAARVAKSAAQ